MLIKKVYPNKKANQKLICIPKDSEIEAGDYVRIIKIEENDQEIKSGGKD